LAVWKTVEKNENKDLVKLSKAIEYFNLDGKTLENIKLLVTGKNQEN
jgi:hypothetical protein